MLQQTCHNLMLFQTARACFGLRDGNVSTVPENRHNGAAVCELLDGLLCAGLSNSKLPFDHPCKLCLSPCLWSALLPCFAHMLCAQQQTRACAEPQTRLTSTCWDDGVDVGICSSLLALALDAGVFCVDLGQQLDHGLLGTLVIV
jgi:hypothetical protein